MDEKQQVGLLETFVIDNPRLDELESLIAEFNIFEALGAVHQELRHSDFLAFLLNPAEKHGLGDVFLKRFLMRVLSVADEPPVTPITINVIHLADAIVEREAQNIDILIHDADSGLVCIIENKIYSGEHDNQLERYLRSARQRFPDARAIIPVFLTPDGIPPADEDSPYIPFSYGQVLGIMEQVRQAQESLLGADVNTIMRHYVTMLRRYIVSESEIADLCRQIYRAHKAAIDLIIEHMPDLQQGLSDYLGSLVDQTPGLTLVRHSKTYIDFIVEDWKQRAELNMGVGWPPSSALVTVELYNGPNNLNLYLMLGPVKPEHQYIREAIFANADTNRDVFKECRRNITQMWSTLYKMRFLRPKDYDGASLEDLVQIIEPKWEHFVREILPQLSEHLMQIRFD